MSVFPADKSKNPLAGYAMTVDGPTCSGKGTLAKALAERWRLKFLDTGAIYRAVAWRVLQAGEVPADAAAAERAARELQFDFKHKGNNVFGVWVDGVEVTEELRTPRVDSAVPLVATQPKVREILKDFQVNYAKTWKDLTGVVLDGRDTGGRICPGAEVKIFLTAGVEARGRRRWLEYTAKGKDISVEEVTQQLMLRDARDAENLMKPAEAVVIDATEMDAAGVLKAAVAAVEAKLGPVAAAPKGV